MVRSFALLIVLLSSVRADVTVRYQTTITASPIMPPEAQDQLKKAGSVPITMLVKGSKGYTLAGNFASVSDLAKQTTTLMNTETKTFASVAMNDYQQAVSLMVPKPSADAQAMLANMETKFESKNTGRKQTIQGILAEERQIVMTMSSKVATDQETPGQMMRMVMEIWSAAPSEAARVPALGEIERFSALTQTAMNPTAMIQQLLGPYSGMAKGYDALAKELSDHQTLVLRTHVSIYVPAMTQAVTALARTGRQVPAFNPTGPLSEINQEVVELSTAPVDASVFEVPASYKQSTVGEILKSRFPQLGEK
jgi:hypothetical protein